MVRLAIVITFMLVVANDKRDKRIERAGLLQAVNGFAEVGVLLVEQGRERLTLRRKKKNISQKRVLSVRKVINEGRGKLTLSRPRVTCSTGRANLPLASAGGTSL